jgi:hypothetical protein
MKVFSFFAGLAYAFILKLDPIICHVSYDVFGRLKQKIINTYLIIKT